MQSYGCANLVPIVAPEIRCLTPQLSQKKYCSMQTPAL